VRARARATRYVFMEIGTEGSQGKPEKCKHKNINSIMDC